MWCHGINSSILPKPTIAILRSPLRDYNLLSNHKVITQLNVISLFQFAAYDTRTCERYMVFVLRGPFRNVYIHFGTCDPFRCLPIPCMFDLQWFRRVYHCKRAFLKLPSFLSFLLVTGSRKWHLILLPMIMCTSPDKDVPNTNHKLNKLSGSIEN